MPRAWSTRVVRRTAASQRPASCAPSRAAARYTERFDSPSRDDEAYRPAYDRGLTTSGDQRRTDGREWSKRSSQPPRGRSRARREFCRLRNATLRRRHVDGDRSRLRAPVIAAWKPTTARCLTNVGGGTGERADAVVNGDAPTADADPDGVFWLSGDRDCAGRLAHRRSARDGEMRRAAWREVLH